jgi:dihydropteroate synthase
VKISVDTMSSIVAEQAIAAGADIINDVSAGRSDPKMAPLIARNSEIQYIAMHSRGQGAGMADEGYGDIVQDVISELTADIDRLLEAGVRRDQIIFDPGPGFSKSTGELNWPLLARFGEFTALGFPVLFAASRKRFLGELLNGAPPKERDIATAATSLIALQKGAWGVRVHDVKATADVLRVAQAVSDFDNGHVTPAVDSYILKVNRLSFNAIHGVKPAEKLAPQPFLVDIEIGLDPSLLPKLQDDIENGLSYSQLAKVAKRVVEGESVDLIETLAQRILDGVMELSSDINRAKVTIHKPSAPIDAQFDDVICTLEAVR